MISLTFLIFIPTDDHVRSHTIVLPPVSAPIPYLLLLMLIQPHVSFLSIIFLFRPSLCLIPLCNTRPVRSTCPTPSPLYSGSVLPVVSRLCQLRIPPHFTRTPTDSEARHYSELTPKDSTCSPLYQSWHTQLRFPAQRPHHYSPGPFNILPGYLTPGLLRQTRVAAVRP